MKDRQAALASKSVRISCVVPVFNEQDVIAPFVMKLTETLASLATNYDIIVVDDGSRDETVTAIQALSSDYPVKLLGLSRNFGKETALTAGIDHAEGDVVILMDADFQHPIEMLTVFLQKWAEGYDMVYGERHDRESESAVKRNFARLFYWVMKKITSINIPSNAGDFRLMDKKIVAAFLLQSLFSQIRRCWQAREEHTATLFLLIWAIVVFTFFSIPHSKTISYIIPIFPALALLVGQQLAINWDKSQADCGLKLAMSLFVIFNTLLAAAFFALPYYQWMDIALSATPTLFMVGSVLGLSAIIVTLFWRRLRVASLFYICTLTSAAMLLSLTMGATHLNPNSAKPLVKKLETILQPTDTVVNYFKFYQDVPLYLKRTIILVADWESPTIAERDNWVRELWYSMPFQNTDEILLNETTFWKRWHSDEMMYVFVNKNYLDQFQSHTKQVYVIGRHEDIILIGNHSRPEKQ